MSRCTAPRRGHKDAAAAAQCPRCRTSIVPKFEAGTLGVAAQSAVATVGAMVARERRFAAARVTTSAEVLSVLTRFPEPEVRMAALGNPSCPPEALERAADQEPIIVAGNPSTPPDLLLSLLRDANSLPEVFALASNPSMPEEGLDRVMASYLDSRRATDEAKAERLAMSLVHNPSLPSEHVRSLAEDRDAAVRRKAASHPNASDDVLAALALDEESSVRLAVVDREASTPERIRFAADNGLHAVAVCDLGIAADNDRALEALREVSWWTAEPDSPQVLLIKAVHRDR